MRRWIHCFIMCALAAIITACGNEQPKQDYFSDDHPEAVALFKNQCISCHATDLRGHAGERSNLQNVGDKLSQDEIIDVIKNGRNLMPAQKNLSDEQIEQLALWLSEQKH